MTVSILPDSWTSTENVALDDFSDRIARIQRHGGNSSCADCAEKEPQWASFLKSSSDCNQGSTINLCVLVCQKCALHHHKELGENGCRIKYLKYFHEWSRHEVDILHYSGNSRVNRVYEAFLTEKGESNSKVCKSISYPGAGDEEKRRAKFIKDKYRKWRFLDESALERALDKVSHKMKLTHESSSGSKSKLDLSKESRKARRSSSKDYPKTSNGGASERRRSSTDRNKRLDEPRKEREVDLPKLAPILKTRQDENPKRGARKAHSTRDLVRPREDQPGLSRTVTDPTSLASKDKPCGRLAGLSRRKESRSSRSVLSSSWPAPSSKRTVDRSKSTLSGDSRRSMNKARSERCLTRSTSTLNPNFKPRSGRTRVVRASSTRALECHGNAVRRASQLSQPRRKPTRVRTLSPTSAKLIAFRKRADRRATLAA